MLCPIRASSVWATLKANNTPKNGWSPVRTNHANLWCGGRVVEEHEEEIVARKKRRAKEAESKRKEREEELEEEAWKWLLWARMFVANTHDDLQMCL